MEKTLLIIGDPKGTASLSALKKYAPENITVWENDSRHVYTISQICDKINIILDDNSLSNLTECNMKFDCIIGNPPYDNQMYREFLGAIPDIIDENGKFDLLFPVYTFTRKKCIDILKTKVKIDRIDMTAGHHFKNSINGAWVIRITGTIGKTDKFDIVMPNGDVVRDRTLDDINPSSAKFIEASVKKEIDPLTAEDFTIVKKVMTSTIQLHKHKENIIPHNNIVYLHPSLHQMSGKKGSRFPGAFSLRGFTSQNDNTKNGFYCVTDSVEQSETMYNILCTSKLFVYLYWIIASDSMYTDNFIKMLPDVSNMAYKNEAELYEQFNLTDKEIQRIESIF